MNLITSLLGARRAGALLALCAATGALAAGAPGSAEACQPEYIDQVPLTDGATLPPDGLVLFDPGPWGWRLDWLIPDGSEPPDSSYTWFQEADVIAVTDANGTAVDGDLEDVSSWIAWRPTHDLPTGTYTVSWRLGGSGGEFETFNFEVSAAAEGSLPTFDAQAITGTVPADFADCDPMNMCVAPNVALSDVEVAVINVDATWSSELLRSQLEITAQPSEAVSPRCVGCNKLDSIERREHQSSYPITVEVRDLRSNEVVHSEQLDVPYAGPTFTTTPRDVAEAILTSSCRTPSAELEEAWCSALPDACSADSSDDRCRTLSETCTAWPITQPCNNGSGTCRNQCTHCDSDDTADTDTDTDTDTAADCSASDGPRKGRAIDLALGLALLGLVWFRRGH